MKRLPIYLTIIILICFTSSFAQQVKYEVKVVLDSVKNVKGTLQKVSPDGISVTDFRGNYYSFIAKNIVKIKVRRKGLNLIQSFAVGTGMGLAAGGALILAVNSDNTDIAIAIAAAFTAVGAVGGTLGGLLGEALNTKLILNINSDLLKFQKDYLKLEKYAKSYDLEKTVLKKN